MDSHPGMHVDASARTAVRGSQRHAAPKPRRTQAERRATTRGALLDAVIACLVEDGYANLTTRRIAERAGVSQGTQQHYFATKSEFVLEAMRYANQQIATDVLQRIDVREFRDPKRQGEILDEIWRIHKSPAFKAALELWIAARTDDGLRRNLRKLEREVVRIIGAAAENGLDGKHPSPLLRELIDLGLAAVRGYAMLAPVVPQAELERRWVAAKKHLLRTLRASLA